MLVLGGTTSFKAAWKTKSLCCSPTVANQIQPAGFQAWKELRKTAADGSNPGRLCGFFLVVGDVAWRTVNPFSAGCVLRVRCVLWWSGGRRVLYSAGSVANGHVQHYSNWVRAPGRSQLSIDKKNRESQSPPTALTSHTMHLLKVKHHLLLKGLGGAMELSQSWPWNYLVGSNVGGGWAI